MSHYDDTNSVVIQSMQAFGCFVLVDNRTSHIHISQAPKRYKTPFSICPVSTATARGFTSVERLSLSCCRSQREDVLCFYLLRKEYLLYLRCKVNPFLIYTQVLYCKKCILFCVSDSISYCGKQSVE